MTFEEALAYKNSLTSAIIKDGSHSYHIFVTPSKHEDFSAYINDVIRYFDHLDDQDAIKFSSDKEFRILALRKHESLIFFKEVNVNT